MSVVDNFAARAALTSLAGKLGDSPTWWAAKCMLRARVEVRSTRSKSTDRNKRSITARKAAKPVRA
jgi:hypothetical protein